MYVAMYISVAVEYIAQDMTKDLVKQYAFIYYWFNQTYRLKI